MILREGMLFIEQFEHPPFKTYHLIVNIGPDYIDWMWLDWGEGIHYVQIPNLNVITRDEKGLSPNYIRIA